MVRLFGAARFHFVNWPEGIKDANAMLVSDGSEALRGLVEDGALPFGPLRESIASVSFLSRFR
jgi:twinkle protein